jgi:hypothetical protein
VVTVHWLVRSEIEKSLSLTADTLVYHHLQFGGKIEEPERLGELVRHGFSFLVERFRLSVVVE